MCRRYVDKVPADPSESVVYRGRGGTFPTSIDRLDRRGSHGVGNVTGQPFPERYLTRRGQTHRS
jgi:hypothetical protein